MAALLNGHALAAMPKHPPEAEVAFRLADLAAFLTELEARPFQWGVCDCLLACADWVERLTGLDPAAHLRARYSDQAGAHAHIAAVGGLAAILADCASRAGMIAVAAGEALVAGDVALVSLPQLAGGEALTIGGIYCIDGRFAIKTVDGLLGFAARWQAPAWRVPL